MAGSTGRKISTFIELGGEQAFKQALSDASRQVRVMDADLKAVASEFKSTGDAQQYFSQKTELLKSKIAEQERYVDMLKAGVKAAAGTYGEASSQADGYRIKLSNATARLYDMRRELEAADREAEEFGRDSAKVGRQIENGIGDGAEEAKKSMKGLVEQMQADIGSIKGSMAFSVASSVVSTVTNVVQRIENFVNEGAERNRKNISFEMAAAIGGRDIDKMYEYAYMLTRQTGDYEAALEAMATLMQTELNDDDLIFAINKFKKYNYQFGEEAKIEDLAESFQETVSSGEPTGKILEVAVRALKQGEDTTKEAMEAIMKDAETIEERAKGILTYITEPDDLEAVERGDKAMEKQGDLIEAQEKVNNANARFSNALAPYVTNLRKFDEVALTIGAETLELAQTEEGAYKELKKIDRVINVGEAFSALKKKLLWSEQETDEKMVEEAKEAAEEWADAYAKGLEEGRPTVQDVMNAYWQTMGTENDPEEVAKSMISKMQPTDEEIAELSALFASIGVDAATLFDTSFGAAMDTAASNAEISGQNAGVSLGNGLNTGLSGAYDVATSWASQINSVLGSIGQGLSYAPVYGGASGSGIGSNGNSPIIINNAFKVDGKTLYKGADTYAGRKASRLG